MRRLLLFTVALIALAGRGQAADLAYKAQPPNPLYDWTGLYVGGHVAWERADTAGFTSAIDTPGGLNPFLNSVTPTSQAISGWRAGGQAGYNYQFHRAVFGFELSGSWDNVSGASSSTLALPALLPNAQSPAACYQLVNLNAIGGAANTYSCQAKQDWSVQALARVGYAIADGRFLPYVTGGVGFTHLTVANSITFVQGFPGAPVQIQNVFGSDKVLLGLIIGGGAQYAFGNGFSIGAEYQYAKYATQDFSSIATSTCVGACGGAGITTHLFPAQESHDLTTNTVRVVLNYKITD